jgi:hypothetical protein
MRLYALPTIVEQPVAAINDQRRIGMIASGPALAAAQRVGLQLTAHWQAEPAEASELHFQHLAQQCPPDLEVIYAIGGGLAVDAAICCPSAASATNCNPNRAFG